MTDTCCCLDYDLISLQSIENVQAADTGGEPCSLILQQLLSHHFSLSRLGNKVVTCRHPGMNRWQGEESSM